MKVFTLYLINFNNLKNNFLLKNLKKLNFFFFFVLFMKDNAGFQSPSSAEESNSHALRPTDEDLHALSHLAEQVNSKLAAGANQLEREENCLPHPNAGENVDLDNLFAFLSEIHGDGNKNAMLEEIELQMNELSTDFDQEIQQATDVRYFNSVHSSYQS